MSPALNHPTAIRERKLILVEGKDEEAFCGKYLAHLGITGVQILSSGGKTQFSTKLPTTMLTPGFDQLETLAIIHDADTNAAGTALAT